MKWSESPFGEKINLANVMLASMKDQQEMLTANGIPETYTAELEAQLAAVLNQNVQQEKFKGYLKEATSLLNEETDKLWALYAKAKKVIKINMPLPAWKKFGFDDKR